jgi:hypothetical protein
MSGEVRQQQFVDSVGGLVGRKVADARQHFALKDTLATGSWPCWQFSR